MKWQKKLLLLCSLFFVFFVALSSLGATSPEIPTQSLPVQSVDLPLPSWVEVILEESETSPRINLILPSMMEFFTELESEQRNLASRLLALQKELNTLQSETVPSLRILPMSLMIELEKAEALQIESENRYRRTKWERDILLGMTGGLLFTGIGIYIATQL